MIGKATDLGVASFWGSLLSELYGTSQLNKKIL